MTPDAQRIPPRIFQKLYRQPDAVIIKQTDGLFIKRTIVQAAGTALPQHSHTYDHVSFLAAGAVSVFVEGKHLGDFTAPEGIVIKAHAKHLFITQTDGTIIDCIHRIDRDGEPEIAEVAAPLV